MSTNKVDALKIVGIQSYQFAELWEIDFTRS